jgi:esterase/lipase superfamily enzyme
MQIKELGWYSERLHRQTTIKIYGHAGKPCLVIPSQNGKRNDFEGFGMVGVCSPWIEAGKLQLFCVDTIDEETVSCTWKNPRERMELHESWVQYLIQEVCPLMENHSYAGKAMTMGCSMGAYHAGNLFFRFPDHFDATICLSGVYDAHNYMGDYSDDLVYLNSPCQCLRNMPSDHPYMELYRNSHMFFCVGQGAWEDELLDGTHALEAVLREKGIPAWIDYWGYDVNHDWDWWRKQIVYFLGKLDL